MKMKLVYGGGVLLALMPSLLAAADPSTKAAEPQLSVAQIVEKNVRARGGLDRWRHLADSGDEGQNAGRRKQAPNDPSSGYRDRPGSSHATTN